MILPTEILKKMVDDIISIERHNAITIKLMIRNRQDTSLTIDNSLIDTIDINQSFATNTTDDIQVTVNMTPSQVKTLVASQTDLYADMIIEYVDATTGHVVLDEKPIKLHYKVFVHDLSTLTKRFGVNTFENTDSSENVSNTHGAVYVRVDMQMMPDQEYNANRASFVGMVRNSNVEELIKYMTSTIGITKLKMVPPDNQTKYQHVHIPPEHSNFRAAFDYLQSKFGVYANGFRHYMTNGTLYVYPPFDMNSDRKPRLNIIRVSENTYLGPSNFHKEEDNKDLTIITNTKLTSKTLSNVGSENEGNTKVFVRSDGIFDGQVNHDDMSLVNITASMSSKADTSISKDAAVVRYVKPTLNLMHHASKFSEANTELMTFGWSNARINVIEPGTPTTFIFDEKSKVMSKTGLVEAVRYSIRRARSIFTCGATLIIRSDPTPIPYDK